jgi:hypothetical protein
MDLNFYEKEKREMAESQLHFIKYAAEEILEYISMGGKIEEWYQNKLTKVHSDMEGMHSWMEGEKRRTGMVSEDVDQIEELKTSTLTRYGTKATQSLGRDPEKTDKRVKGIQTARYKVQQKSMKKEEVEQLSELSNKLLDRYKEKAAADSLKSDREGNYKRGDKRFSGVVKATNKQFAYMRKQPFGKELDEGENRQVKGGDPCWKGYEMVGMKKKGGKDVPNCVPVKEQVSDAPFDPPYSNKPSSVKDKSGAIHGPMSRVKHLAKMAAKRQAERMKDKPTMKTTQESVELQESRRSEIVREAMKVAKDKKKKETKKTDTFEAEPELSTAIHKTDV